MALPVYLVSYFGTTLNHQAIFVETHREKKSGCIYHVEGSTYNDMFHNHKPAKRPEESEIFISTQPLGFVAEADYSRIRTIVDAIPPPPKQFQGRKRLYPGRGL